MAQAKSQVQVSITAQLSNGFKQAFTSADKQMRQLGASATDLSKKVGDVAAYRRQQNALKEAASAYTQARAKVAALKAEIEKSGTATRKQAADLNRAEQAARRAGAAYQQQRTALADMGRALQQAGVNTAKLSQEYRRLQGELAKTQASYARQEASLQRQAKLVQGMQKAWQGMQSAIAGAVGGAAVLAAPTRKAMTFDEQLTYMTDTAAAGKSMADKEAMKKRLSNAIEAARKFSGGAKREDVGSALNTMIASGMFEGDEAAQALPAVARAAFAGGASSEDMAKTAVALKQYGIKDVGGEFDKILRAGQLGNFEMRDMARWLPQQLALAKSAGITGPQGLSDLLAFNQVARGVSGTSDEAGNNVVNLLQKFTSREFADSMAKNVQGMPGGPTKAGKKGSKAFDWQSYMIQRRGQGVTAIEAFGEVMQHQLASNKQYTSLQQKLKTASGADRQQTLEAMATIATGSELGKIIADRQALMAAIAATNGKAQMVELNKGIAGSAGAVEQSAAFVGSQTWAKSQMASGALDRANEQTYNSVSGALAGVLDGFNGLTEQFPKLTTAAYGAGVALTALAAAGAASNLPNILRGGAAAGGAALPGGTTTVAAAGAAGWLGKAKSLAKGGLIAAALGYATDAGLGKMGVGGKPIDEAQDDANWNKASTWEKIQSAVPRGIEKAGSLLFMDNLMNEARAARIQQETAYLAAKGGYTNAKPQGTSVAAGYLSGGGTGAAANTAEAAKAAAAAAQEAAKAANVKPNVTVTNNYQISVPVQQPDAALLAQQIQQQLRVQDQKRAAEQRSLLTDRLGY